MMKGELLMGKTNLSANFKGGMVFETDIGGHKILMDADKDVGGNDSGVRPRPLLLASLMGCTGMDVISILRKMRVDLDDLKIEVEADNVLEHPRVYENIHLIYRFWGKDLPKDKLNQAVKLSQKNYCPASAMLKKATDITYEIRVEES